MAKDKKDYKRRAPAWKETDEDEEKYHNNESNEINLRRCKELEDKAFIMDAIQREGEKRKKAYMLHYDTLIRGCPTTPDDQLVAPWIQASVSAKKPGNENLLRDLEMIKAHVEKVRILHRSELAKFSPKRRPTRNSFPTADKGVGFTDLKIEMRQDILRKVSKEFASKPSGLNIVGDGWSRELKASYAILHDAEACRASGSKTWTRFPWDVAMRDLCDIKVKALGPYKTITSNFYEKMTLCHFARS